MKSEILSENDVTRVCTVALEPESECPWFVEIFPAKDAGENTRRVIVYVDNGKKTLTVVHDEGFVYPKEYHDRRTAILKKDCIYGKSCFDGSRCRPRFPGGPGGLIDMDLRSGYVDFCEFPAGVDVRVGTWRYGENGLQYSQTRKPVFRVPKTEAEAETSLNQGPPSPSLDSLPMKDLLVLDTENEVKTSGQE